jgi:hypothetical protein
MSSADLDTIIRKDFEEWSGGFPPDSLAQIDAYVESSSPIHLCASEARESLIRWMRSESRRSTDAP